ncbi:MAG: hypothetical protein V4719_29755 [Planctomycetota bacterium]
MSGFLYHAKSFRCITHIGNDGLNHHEIEAVEGNWEGISYSTWKDIKKICETFGVPQDVWPDYVGHDYAIDIPIIEVMERQKRLRNTLNSLSAEQIKSHPWLEKIAAWIRNEESVFFC